MRRWTDWRIAVHYYRRFGNFQGSVLMQPAWLLSDVMEVIQDELDSEPDFIFIKPGMITAGIVNTAMWTL